MNIRRLSGAGTPVCTWAGIVGHDGKTLDLSDSFRNEEVWADGPEPQSIEALLSLGDRFGNERRVNPTFVFSTRGNRQRCPADDFLRAATSGS